MTIKDFFNHPLMSPITKPAKTLGQVAYAPIKPFFDAVAEEYQDCLKQGQNEASALLNSWGAIITKTEDIFDSGTASATALISGVLGLAGGIWAGIVAGGAYGVAGGIATGIVTAGVTFFAAPVAALCLASAAITAVAIPMIGTVNFIRGMVNAISYASDPKGYVAKQVAKAAAGPTPVTTGGKTIAEEMEDLDKPARQALIENLQEKFKGDFDAVSSRKIAEAAENGLSKTTQTPVIPDMKKKPFEPGGKK